MRLVTVRHAATLSSERHIIAGRRDEPLSDLGRRQASELAAALGPMTADVVVSSPLSRALDTARILTGLPATRIELEPLALERSYGELEGIPPEQVAAMADRITYVEAGGIRHSIDPPGGEPLDEVRQRAERLARIIHDRGGGELLLVAHQVILQQLHGVLLGLDTIGAMGRDLRVLQIDEFEIDAAMHATQLRRVHDGVAVLTSW